ncbi:MAG: acetyl-CoA carboxylase biotin carboxyl carrier protein subunit [Bacteroidales bacterium]|nr:acetyl-CoA carboxylase biotin carboxyl carrier protein subunit [Bacteroidales bacterium]
MSAKRTKKDVMVNTTDECEKKKLKCKTLVIQEHGTKYRTTFNKKFENRKHWVKPNPNNVFTFIPGTITDVCVKPGDKLRKGDKMLVLEAMKMLNSIEISRDATIKEVFVKKGDRIPKGHLIIEIE